MKNLGIYLLICLFVMAGCQMRQSQITVLPDKVQGGDDKTGRYVVNGGPGSTEATFTDEKGQKWSVDSNVVRVPIQEKCEEEQVIVDTPEVLPRDPLATTVAVNTFPNQIVLAAKDMPGVGFRTDSIVPKNPPRITLTKTSDEDVLCCDRQLTFRIKFTNDGGDNAYNIEIFDIVPANVEYLEDTAGCEPYTANIFFDRGVEEKVKKVTWLIEGPIPPGGDGEVYYTVVCPTVQPKLSCYLRFEPKIFRVGEPGTIICSINNGGTGVAEQVKMNVFLPAGIEYQGESAGKQHTIDFDKIEPGKSGVRELKIKALSGANMNEITASVTSKNSESCDCVVPPTPSLMIEKTGPANITNANPMVYTIVVKNVSSKPSPATNCVLTDKLPEGVMFQEASDGGTYDREKHVVTWNLGNLMTGDIATRTIILLAMKSGTFVDEAEVRCDEGLTVKDDASTLVHGIAAMHISKYDTEDPVEVGQTTTFVIESRNEGFKDATSVCMEVEIPELAEVINIKGTDSHGQPIEAKNEDNKVVFNSVAILESGEKCVYNVTVKVKAKGQLLFRGTLRYNEFGKAISVEEPTTSYE